MEEWAALSRVFNILIILLTFLSVLLIGYALPYLGEKNVPLYSVLSFAVMLFIVFLKVYKRRELANFFVGLFLVSFFFSAPALAGYAPLYIVSLYLHGEEPESPFLRELLPKINVNDPFSLPMLSIILVWTVFLLSQFMLGYAVYILLRSFWVSVEKTPRPLVKSVHFASLGLLSSRVANLITAAAGFSSTFLLGSSLIPYVFAGVTAFLTTFSFGLSGLVGSFVAYVIADKADKFGFTLGAILGYLFMMVFFSFISRRRYSKYYEVNLPAPALLFILFLVLGSLALFLLASFDAVFIIVIDLALFCLIVPVLVRLDHSMTLLLIVFLGEGQSYFPSKTLPPFSLLSFYKPFSDYLIPILFVFIVPLFPVIFGSALAFIDESKILQSFKGGLLMILTAGLSIFASSLFYAYLHLKEAFTLFSPERFIAISIYPSYNPAYVVLGILVSSFFFFIYIASTKKVPLDPSGFLFGVLLLYYFGFEGLLASAIIFSSTVLKLVLSRRVATGVLIEKSSLLLWGLSTSYAAQIIIRVLYNFTL